MSVSPIQIDTTQIRTQSPRNPYGMGGADKFFNGLQTAMGLIGPAVSMGIGQASPTGGAITSAALSVLGNQQPSYSLGNPSGLTKQFGGLGAAPGYTGGSGAGIAGSSGLSGMGSGTQVDMATQMQAMQSMNSDMLAAQMAVQQENRTWSMISNIKKAEHDTLKASINNIRAS